MFVKIIEQYKDKEFNTIIPKGVILEVTKERATILKERGKAVDFEFAAKPVKNKKSETVEVKEEDILKVEEVPVEDIPAEAEVVDEVKIVDEATEQTEE